MLYKPYSKTRYDAVCAAIDALPFDDRTLILAKMLDGGFQLSDGAIDALIDAGPIVDRLYATLEAEQVAA